MSQAPETSSRASRRGAPFFGIVPAIALNTFREAVRSRILYLILIFALLLMASSGIIRELTISAHDRIVRDLGLAAINFFGLAIAILVGIGLVYNELDKKSIYTIVSKPVARWQFLLGKYFGLLMTIYVNIVIMAVFFLAVIHYQNFMDEDRLSDIMWQRDATGQFVQVDNSSWVYTKYLGESVVKSAGLGVANLFGQKTIAQTQHLNSIIFVTALELAIITAFAMLYSSFSTPTLSAIFTILTFIAGRLNQDIWAYAQKLGEARAAIGGNIQYFLAMGAAHLVPNLGLFRESATGVNQPGYDGVQWFEMVRTVATGDPQGMPLPFGVLPYAFFYTAAILCLAMLIFRSRNFK